MVASMAILTQEIKQVDVHHTSPILGCQQIVWPLAHQVANPICPFLGYLVLEMVHFCRDIAPRSSGGPQPAWGRGGQLSVHGTYAFSEKGGVDPKMASGLSGN